MRMWNQLLLSGRNASGFGFGTPTIYQIICIFVNIIGWWSVGAYELSIDASRRTGDSGVREPHDERAPPGRRERINLRASVRGRDDRHCGDGGRRECSSAVCAVGASRDLLAAAGLLHFLEHLVEIKGLRLLPLRILLEGLQELTDIRLSG